MDLLHPAAFLLHVFQAEDVNAVTVSFTTSTLMKQLESLRDKVHKLQIVTLPIQGGERRISRCTLLELVGLDIEKTEDAYLKSFPCIVVKKTFQVTCGVASFQIQKINLILFCGLPASSRR